MSSRYLPDDNHDYLSKQLITYLGNKRALLPHIDAAVCDVRDALGGRKLRCGDLFSGSGAVARLLKKHSDLLCVNDLEGYSAILNRCYLTNREDFPRDAYEAAFEQAQKEVDDLHQRTREGIETARQAGKQIGRPGGKTYTTQRELSSLSVIKRLSRDFDGHNTDAEVMAITGLARNTYYKYKAKLKSTLKIEAA